MTPEHIAALDELFAPWNRSDAPGLAVGIAWQGAPAYRRGFGMASLESAAALTPTTRLRIGSTTKHFTALLALLLAEDGALDLDTAIRSYLPELAGPGGDPTLRELLGHRGGARCYLDLGFIAHGMATPPPGRALAIQARQRARNFAPGEAVMYNNGGYHLVSEAIARAGGAPFNEQLARRLFAPLGMADTLLLESDHIILPRLATLHVPAPGGGWRRGLFPSEEVLGEGGIVSTVDDMLRWAAHLRRRDRFGTPASWAALTEPGRLADGTAGIYALGLIVDTYRGRPILHHAGGVIGGSSQLLTFPEDGLDIVILANGAPGADPTVLAERVADILLGDALGEKPKDVREEDHPDLTGHWWSPESGMVYAIVPHEGSLRMGMCGGPALPLRPAADGLLLLRTGAIGDILVDPAPNASGSLSIRFGLSAIAHTRLAATPEAAAPFAAAARGRYWCEDAECSAVIEGEGEGLRLILSDPYGRSEMVVEPLGEGVALARRHVGQIPFGLALALDGAGGFQVSTSRTRFLAFTPV
jgi:CubicO group peptidase (beta-lactamase class C family)